MDKGNETTFVGACRDHFGYRTGQGLQEFFVELKALNPDDVREISDGLRKEGYNIKAA